MDRAALKLRFNEYRARTVAGARRAGQAALYVLLSPFRLLKLVCLVLGFVTLLAATTASIYAYSFYKSLPDLKRMGFEGLKAVATAEVNRRLEDKSRPHPWVSLKDVSRDFLFAIIMSEDAKFYEHKGLNYDAIIDSLAENLRRREYAFGASTITQQVAKNLFLDNEKTLMRKLKEFLITRSLEATFTKNQIVETYLNIVELGPDLYGVAAAAPVFFRKRPAEINAAEGAFIALMLPSPRRNFYSIFQNQNLTPPRRKAIRRVLRDLAYFEFISVAQYHEYARYNYFAAAPAAAPSAISAVYAPTTREPARAPSKKSARRGSRRRSRH